MKTIMKSLDHSVFKDIITCFFHKIVLFNQCKDVTILKELQGSISAISNS